MTDHLQMQLHDAWRVSNHQPRNIYYRNVEVAVAVGSEADAADVAQRICEAMNYLDQRLAEENFRKSPRVPKGSG